MLQFGDAFVFVVKILQMAFKEKQGGCLEACFCHTIKKIKKVFISQL